MIFSLLLPAVLWLALWSSAPRLVAAVPLDQTVFAPSDQPISQLRGKHAAIACETEICSKVGIALNEAGGNAADMIVGTTLCIGTVAMYHAGIGGGGFALVHLPNGTFKALDFREAAPSHASPDMWAAEPLTQIFGGLASGIPGELRGLEYIHSNFGKLPWSSVVAPSVRLAIDGWLVNKDLERYMDVTVQRIGDFFTADPDWAEDFAPNGTRLALGDTIRRPKFGRVLEKIGREGAGIFYEGEIADQIVATNRKHGGLFTKEDMRHYKLNIRDPISIKYGNLTVTSVPAPAGGPSVLSILKIMEGYDFEDGTNLTMHRLNEAFRFASGARAELGDPAYVDGTEDLQKTIITEEYAEMVRKRISDNHTLGWDDYAPSGYETHESHGTSHIVASDSSGMTITLTTTVNLYFGSGVIVPETGIILNDQMADFSTPYPAPPFYRPPAPANFARPGKRPLSACSPTIVTMSSNNNQTTHEDDRTNIDLSSASRPPVLAVGAAGGTRIVTLIASLLLMLLPPYMPHPDSSRAQPPPLKEALALSRIHDSLTPNETSLEFGDAQYGVDGFDNATAAFLASRGHKLKWVEPHYSAAQIIGWQCDGEPESQNCGFVAASDPRHRFAGAQVR